MEIAKRKRFQGVTNIIRFNWPLYLWSFIVSGFLYLISAIVASPLRQAILAAAVLAILTAVISLVVSFYVYDLSGLYSFKWMKNLEPGTKKQVINIHAGFDESSESITSFFSDSRFFVYDFYDEKVHTEPSVRRARKMYPSFPGTTKISTAGLPSASKGSALVFLIFAVHEVRNRSERIHFLARLREQLDIDGSIVVVEHLRDLPNFLAYNIGYLHFYSRKEWLSCFTAAGLIVESEEPLNPFVRKFILKAK